MYKHSVATDFGRQATPHASCRSAIRSRYVRHGHDARKFLEANYPANVIFWHSLMADCEFDFVVSDQVLEHVEGDPYVAVAETLRVLKPWRHAIHTTAS